MIVDNGLGKLAHAAVGRGAASRGTARPLPLVFVLPVFTEVAQVREQNLMLLDSIVSTAARPVVVSPYLKGGKVVEVPCLLGRAPAGLPFNSMKSRVQTPDRGRSRDVPASGLE